MFARILGSILPTGWTPAALGDLTGKHYVITGGNSGLGFEAARVLAQRGGRVTIMCRSEKRGTEALARLKKAVPGAGLDFVPLDLADLGSVRRAADQVRQGTTGIEALINNAGLMALPKREVTADGFEMQLGVNHLSHFALAGLLADLVENAAGRFVAVSSIAHKRGRIALDDLQSERAYDPWAAYGQSKLANLMFALELDRRLRAKRSRALAIACHPGVSATNLFTVGAPPLKAAVGTALGKLFFQPAELGAWPEVLAAAAPDAQSGQYYGPTALRDWMGPIGRAPIAPHGRDAEVARRLWDASEALTGVRWPSPA